MSHTTKVKGDPGINVDIEIRRARALTINWKHFSDSDHTTPHDISADAFRLIIKPTPESADTEAYVDVTSVDDLTINEHIISYDLSAEDSDIDRPKVWYELINTTTGQNWYQGYMPIVRGKGSDNLETDIEETLNLNGVNINTQLTVMGFNPEDITEDQAYVLWQNYFSKFVVGQTPPL